MTWSYNTALTAPKDQVRLLIGDTDTSDQLLQDEEIAFVLANESSVSLASAVCCELLAAKFARQVNTQNGALRVSAQKRHDNFLKIADRLRRGGAGTLPGDSLNILATPFAGGLSKSGLDSLAADDDLVQPSFYVGQDDYPQGDALPEDLSRGD